MTSGRRVDFIVAGVQKGGTTALFRYLCEVPDLQLPRIKEAHFFDDESVDWANPDYRRYHDLFHEDGRLRGEVTPIYTYWPRSLERLRAYNPATKLIVLFRDPIERAWSHWKMEFAKGKETQPFAWCIREGRARVGAGDAAAPGHHRVFSYVERGFYGRQTRRMLELFPATQCLLLKSEDLRDQPGAVMRRVCAFLDVPHPAADAVPRIEHAAVAAAYPSRLERDDVALLAGLYREEMGRFEALSGLSTAGWAERWTGDQKRA
jgi:hypothetical protein